MVCLIFFFFGFPLGFPLAFLGIGISWLCLEMLLFLFLVFSCCVVVLF